jgi:hypothetical protein
LRRKLSSTTRYALAPRWQTLTALAVTSESIPDAARTAPEKRT